MATPPDKLLREIGEALDGEQWQSALARRLCITVRTVQRWVAGDVPLPPERQVELVDYFMLEAAPQLLMQLRKRIAHIEALQKRVPRDRMPERI